MIKEFFRDITPITRMRPSPPSTDRSVVVAVEASSEGVERILGRKKL